MGLSFQRLNARCESLDVLAELGGEVIDLGAPAIEGLREQQHRLLLRRKRIQLLFRGRHTGC